MRVYGNSYPAGFQNSMKVDNAAIAEDNSSKLKSEAMKNSENNYNSARSLNYRDTISATLTISRGAEDRQRLMAAIKNVTEDKIGNVSLANQATSELNRAMDTVSAEKEHSLGLMGGAESAEGIRAIGLEYSQNSSDQVKASMAQSQLNITKSFMLNDPKSAMMAQSHQLSNNVLNLLK